jgi:hypothetical protein
MTFRRRTLLTFLIVLIVATIGAIGIKADPLCRRLVREYREKQVRNRVSKETAARWAEWNKSHPNFHPHARPKYKMVPEEVTKEVNFVCQVPVKPVDVAIDIPPITPDFTLEPVAPSIVIPPPVLPTVVQVSTASTPPPPFLPPYSPGLPPGLSPVPEPSSFVLMTTGAALLGACMFFKRRQAAATL